VADAWTTAPSAGRDSAGFLFAPDGHVITQSPADLPPAVDTDGPAFRSAWQGQESYVPLVDDRDMPRAYFVVPVTRQGTVVAVWAFGVSNDHGPGQQQLELAGGTQYPHGGFSLIDSNGTVTSSWRREQMGRHFTDPANLVDLPSGEARVIVGPDAVQVVSPWIDPVADRGSNIYMALEVPTDEFYGDLRVGQTTRDLSLLLLVLTAVAGLAFVNHRRERAVRRSEARLDALLQNAHDLVVVLDDAGLATFVSSAVLRLLGYAVDERTGRAFADLAHPDDRDRLASVLEAAERWQTGTGTDIRLLDHDGNPRWYDIVAVDRRSDPLVNGLLLTCHEVGERKALQDQLTYRARHDALTGLANRATLTEYLDRLSSGLGDGSAAPFAILFVDLDHFKPVNDTLGHDAGDEVLRVIADRFRQQVRSGDETTGDLVCRLGGDEFAVIIENATELTARQTAERLLDAARQPVPVGDHVVRVSATIGVSLSHPGHVSADETLRQADLAMYQAKTDGRDNFATAPVAD
jgi:diguanylate cyclase (GGDEF)-like protein/PAS domain S-box-containing protein